MKERVHAAMARVDARVIVLLAVVALALVLVEGWQLVLRKPYAEYRRAHTAIEALAAARESAGARRADIERLEAELAAQSRKLEEAVGKAAPDAQIAADLMSVLDAAASRDGVVLLGVRPAGRRSVGGLDEVSFDVAAQGAYLALCRWMMSVSGEAAGARVDGFEMRAGETGAKVVATARIVLYVRSAQGGA